MENTLLLGFLGSLVAGLLTAVGALPVLLGKTPSRGFRDLALGFAAGVMLRALVDADPASIVARPDDADVSKPAYFWPEGYLYVCFCLMLRALVLEEEFARAQQTSHEFESIKTWWSFRENVTEDSSTAIAFLDLFAGDEPNWIFPQIFRSDFH